MAATRIVFIVLALHACSAIAQLSKGVADDSHVDTAGNKFLQREADSDHIRPKKQYSDEAPEGFCPQDLAVRWHTEVESSIYATPVITDLFNDGRKDVVVPGFRRSIHVVDGHTGGMDTTFEASHRSTLHTTPLMFDIDFDGVLDIVVATYDGDVQFFRDTGSEASYRLIVPRLKVRRDWFKGLKSDPTDHSKPDVGADEDDSGIGERAIGRAPGRNRTQTARRRLMQVNGEGTHGANGGAQHQQQQTVTQPHQVTDEAAESFQELFGEHAGEEQGGGGKDAGWLDEDLAEEIEESAFDADYHAAESAEEAAEREARFEHMAAYDDYLLDGADDEHDYEIMRGLWDDDIHTTPDHSRDEPSSPYVFVDPHILANPVIADIDGDKREELVLAVSYFFDPGDYAADSSRALFAVGKDGDVAKYVASGVVVFDLHTRAIKWSQHLDLSTRYTRYKAFAYSPPTLADIDGDGRLEVVLGTSMGFVYILDPKTRSTLEGWPVQMGDIQGQVAVGDLDGDGRLEVIAGDARGSVAALKHNGKELWERHLGSAIGAGATLGDVDGDGALEVVVGTFDGRIYVLDGRTGQDKPGFPFRTYGRIAAPVLITKLNDPKLPGMQLAVTSHDGFLYVIDAITACADSMDLGEASYSMVLADDLAGSGHLDLLVATASGFLYAIRTGAKYHPLKAWPAHAPGLGSAASTARWNWEGVYASATTRVPRDVRGEAVPVRVSLLDKRPPLPGGGKRGPYRISVTLVGVGVKEMNRGDQPIIGTSQVVNATGWYTLDVPCPRTRTSATIRVELQDESGAVFSDEFALSFHIHFYRLLKWLVVGPFIFTAAALLTFSGASGLRAQLPS